MAATPPSFAALPATIRRLLGAAGGDGAIDEPLLRGRFDRVALVYLDAFGLRFLDAQHDHPLVARARREGLCIPLRSQFPSTTTAHTTTIHSGLPVAAHGLYEWHLYEPSLDRLITPLPFSFSGDPGRETLAGVLDPADVFPAESLYATLDVESFVVQPAAFAGSSASRMLVRHAASLAFRSTAEGPALAAAALARAERGYALVYLGEVDTLMHDVGPDDPAVAPAFAHALSAIAEAPFPKGTLVLVTSDHGMEGIDPARTLYVNELWPELPSLLRSGADGRPLAPAGSCRDLFLHVRAGLVDEVRNGLADRLAGRADVVDAAALFEQPSERLRARLADLVVLPHEGEAVWWHEPGRFEQRFRGQHGGLSAREAEIPLLAWVA